MPTYSHVCENPDCLHEWEDVYSIKTDPPKLCPKCNQETAKRVIAFANKGVVELTGRDLIDKIKADARAESADAQRSEKKYANLLGEQKYESLQKQIDRRKRGG